MRVNSHMHSNSCIYKFIEDSKRNLKLGENKYFFIIILQYIVSNQGISSERGSSNPPSRIGTNVLVIDLKKIKSIKFIETDQDHFAQWTFIKMLDNKITFEKYIYRKETWLVPSVTGDILYESAPCEKARFLGHVVEFDKTYVNTSKTLMYLKN